jgi:DNA-binding CsgD family transcriptional regulator/tetratricopeptide (TPR) repeat protein
MEARAAPPLVGRVRELWELERALAAAQGRSGSTILIAADAGMGKTRLASELATRARAAGFEVLVGRSIDLVGTELPFRPFVEALRPLGELRPADVRAPASQLRLFEEALALLSRRAAAAPVLVVLEDLHWADTSTLDLVAFLAHNVDDRRILLVGTYRADEPASAERVRRLGDAVRRSGSALLIELGPLDDAEVAALVADAGAPGALAAAIVTRSEGNPFFAEELLAAADEGGGELPRGLRDLLLQRVSQLDDAAQALLRLAAAAGRDVGYPLLRAVAGLPEDDVRESLRRAVDHGVLVPDQAAGTFRFRHALLAEAVYATILPGEREEIHGRLADELARSGTATAAELAPHWAAAGRHAEALAASVEAAREADAVFGLAEAFAHLERALALWAAVPEAGELAGLDLPALCAWAADRASQVGASPRAIELVDRAIELVGDSDLQRAAGFHVRRGEYLYGVGKDDDALAALSRAVELVPAAPPSAERAYALASLAGGLMVARRHAESLAIAEQVLPLARAVGAGEAEVRAITVVGMDLAYLGRSEEGLAELGRALRLAEEIDDHWGLERVYTNLTDALTMLGRPREAARLGSEGLDAMRRYGIYSPLIVSNHIEALLACGEWDDAYTCSAAALRNITSSFPYALLIVCALVETHRGEYDAARAHLEAATGTLRSDRGHGLYDAWVADLAVWERRWADAEAAIDRALGYARHPHAAHIRVQVCATGLRVQAELAALARARRDAGALGHSLARAEELLAVARSAEQEASPVTPLGAGWLAQTEGEYLRARGESRPEAWAPAAETWDELESPPLAAYCRWREAEALVAAGAARAEASAPLREAYAVASRLGARPLLHELELLAERARLDPTTPAGAAAEGDSLKDVLGLTPREAEVLALVARGLTNREIANELVISVKTAGVHVSHILRKLDAPNRREAAAIAQRVAAPHAAQPGLDA